MKLKILNLSNLFILLTILTAWWTTASLINPFIHYSFQQTSFITTLEFFWNFSSYPGGIADYLAEFVAQFFSFNLSGSMLIVAIASLQGFIALGIVKQLAGEIKARYTIFTLILFLGVIVLCEYRYPYYASIRLLIAYLFTLGFCLIHINYPKLIAYIWFVFACLLFYIAGAAALFVYALSTVFILIITHKQRFQLIFIPLFLFFAGILPYLGYKFIFPMTLKNIYRITIVKPPEALAYVPDIQLYVYYSLLPGVLLAVLFFMWISKKKQTVKTFHGKTKPKISFYAKTPFIVAFQVVLCAAFGYFLFIKSYDPFKKNLLTIEYYAEHEQWSDVLKTAEEINIYDFRVNFQVNRAYSHFGQLPERLFNYPQLLGSFGLFVDPGMQIGNSNMPTSDLYFDLGFMSEAQHWAFEAQTLLPYSPRVLKRLVMINLVNRKYNLAEKFLKVLDKNMLYHDWVYEYQKYVADTTLAAADPLIAEKRRFTPQKAVVNSGILAGLLLLFETNKDNRMAYDYLLTYLILDSHLTDFVDYLKYYNRYNLKNMPRSWEETLTLYILKNKIIPDFVKPETVSKSCMQRISSFNEILSQFKGDLPAAKNTLLRDFGDTYWYYSLYLSPKVTNVLNNKTQVR